MVPCVHTMQIMSVHSTLVICSLQFLHDAIPTTVRPESSCDVLPRHSIMHRGAWLPAPCSAWFKAAGHFSLVETVLLVQIHPECPVCKCSSPSAPFTYNMTTVPKPCADQPSVGAKLQNLLVSDKRNRRLGGNSNNVCRKSSIQTPNPLCPKYVHEGGVKVAIPPAVGKPLLHTGPCYLQRIRGERGDELGPCGRDEGVENCGARLWVCVLAQTFLKPLIHGKLDGAV